MEPEKLGIFYSGCFRYYPQDAILSNPGGREMQAVAGVFSSRKDAERAVGILQSSGVPLERITYLTPGKVQKDPPIDTAEQPGMGKAIGAVVGAAGGLTGGALLLAAVLPGVGMITVAGILGVAIAVAAGAEVGAVAGGAMENESTKGLPEDELFVYEDALRKGRSVVVVLGEDDASAESFRELLKAEGAESVDAARHQWWTGLRSAELEHYSASPGASSNEFGEDEKFYRMGFEAALHARTRCMEFDQVSAEMESRLEDLQRLYPARNVEKPFTLGYQRGRDYYQRLCDESKAA
jgi:hypothetical protein